ncbi:hypothetical protein AB0E62_36230, partial [Streptomyces sp. NPDC038707]|uniref:hypothetical protein n=1 Tax=Streptomyces sp. NPDC038707 TaxID=3154329 RepID=UPI0033F38A42
MAPPAPERDPCPGGRHRWGPRAVRGACRTRRVSLHLVHGYAPREYAVCYRVHHSTEDGMGAVH